MAYKLLLADDSITIQKVVELVLAEEDFQIKAVSNGEEAMKVIDDFMPDIVLADIEMPKMNGYQLCDKIKKNPATTNVPVILLAGAFEPIDDELAKNVRADDSVIKPFESQELISKINAVLAYGSAASAEEVSEEAVAVAEEEFESAEAVEMIAEEEAPAAEEDLWAMEEVGESAETVEAAEEIAFAEEPVMEEAGLEEAGFAEAEVSAEEALEEPLAVEEEPVALAPEPAPVFAAAPEPAAPARPAAPAATAMPALDPAVLVDAFRKSVDQQVARAIAGLDLKEAVTAALAPMIKESLEKVLWEMAPELTDKMLREVLKGSIASLASQVEKVIWETVPDLAGSMISKEIERIKAEF